MRTVSEIQAAQGWTDETLLLVAQGFIDDHQLGPEFQAHLELCAKEENEEAARLEMNRAPLTVGEAARALGLSPDSIRLYEREGKLAAVKTSGGMRLFDPRDVEALRQSREALRAPKEKAG